MENSIHSSIDSREEGSEESGWTIYFEDFFASEKRETAPPPSSGGCSNSVISDAASYAAWKSPGMAEASRGFGRLSFKKRKTCGALDDDDPLEDTATSPVNSPKVGDMNPLDLISRKEDGNNHMEDGMCKELMRGDDEIDHEMGLLERTNGCTELKKKGLCLVPLTMLVDYLG